MPNSRKEIEINTRKTYIIDIARTLFAKKGVEQTSMEEIARAADYTRKTLYSYFASFDELCLSVFLADQKIRWERQKDAEAKVSTGLEKLTVWGLSLFEFVLANPGYIKLELYWDYHGIEPKKFGKKLFAEYKNRNDALADNLRDIFTLGQKDGSIRKDIDIDMAISHFLYSIRNVINRAVSTGYSFSKFEPKTYVKNFLQIFCRGICP